MTTADVAVHGHTESLNVQNYSETLLSWTVSPGLKADIEGPYFEKNVYVQFKNDKITLMNSI